MRSTDVLGRLPLHYPETAQHQRGWPGVSGPDYSLSNPTQME